MDLAIREGYIFESAHFRFRRNTHRDIGNLFKIMSDREVMQFICEPMTLESVRTWLEYVIGQYEDKEYLAWAAELKQEGRYIGQGFIVEQLIDGDKEIEVGYFLSKEFWGKGYGTEIAAACRDYAINELKYKRVISIINSENMRSIRIALKNGFSYERNIIWRGRSASVYSFES